MAKNDNTRSHQGSNTHSNRATGADRDRRRDAVVNTVKERPYAAAALATVAAGAAAFFLTRSKSDKPLMNWGQDTTGDTVMDSSARKQQGSTTSDRSLETASTSPSSSAGTGAGTGSTSPSAVRAASLSATPNGTNAGTTPGTGAKSSAADAGTNNKSADAGLNQAAKTETKVGAIAYGA
ncbi:hypothetical protein [Sphingomonas glaciei]|uniref:Uncharacterized protein n=1 Tax=Sphingomonas glaciei TaxID=2938948 RepID=A0ABY5MXI2_9SPHN|nr:hypothetical protein [Sphingomonas glaciei]UUR08501.1 hypothetical protein M1K48_02315 [Sphingomonas glaciei]